MDGDDLYTIHPFFYIIINKYIINMEEEIWKIYHNGPRVIWEVSNYGRVKRNGILYECKLHKGYKVFGSWWAVHRAVAELFILNFGIKSCVDHINGNPLDNRACNLRWATPRENSNNPITLKRLSEAKKDKPQSEDHRRKNSESHKGKSHTEKSKRKTSESMKRYWKNKKTQK